MGKVIRSLMFLSLLILVTGCKQEMAEKKVRENLSKFKSTALKNLELEGTTKKHVNSFFDHPAVIPSYKHLMAINKNQSDYKQAANQFSRNDKIRHCYMGFVIAKKHDFKSAIFMSFYKEASDVGDANASTHFEIADMIATRIGARYFKRGEPLAKCLDVNDILADRVAKYEQRIAEAKEKLNAILCVE